MPSKSRFVLSQKKVLGQYTAVKELADSVSYSFKTNYLVGKILEEQTDCFLSVHSLSSLQKMNDCSRAWFFAQGWDAAELFQLKEKNVSHFVVDNTADLEVLLSFIEQNDFFINLLLRMRLKENTIHTGKHYVFGLFARQVNDLIPELKKNKRIQKLGVHFHRKTQNVSEWSLTEEMQDALNKDTLQLIDIINMGGGIPVEYKNYRKGILDGIFAKIQKFKEWANSNNIHLIVEPGRFLAGPPVTLETRVLAVYNKNVILNASVYQASMDTFIAHTRLKVDGEQEKGIPYTLKGSTPCSTDIFRYRVFLNKAPKVGDSIHFLNAGAYNFSTDFCCLTPLETVVVD
jgi:ornithine decarboxylase